MIVVVDPVSTGQRLSDAFSERGEDVLHLYQSVHSAAFDQDPHRRKAFVADPAAAESAVQGLPVTCVVAGSEWGVDTANDLSHRLGLPHHVDALQDSRRDKLAMHRALEAAGVPVAVTRLVRDLPDLQAALGKIERYPVFVKPVSSAGGDGCAVCPEPAAVHTAVVNTLRRTNLLGAHNDAVLVQEYLDGQQYIVNTVSMGGRHLVTDVHRVRVDDINDRAVMRDFVLVADLDAADREVVDYTLRCLDALGVREGAGHTEVRMTSAGPRLVEVNARIMGASMQPALYRRALGYTQADLVAERFTDPAAFARRLTDGYAPIGALAMVFLYAGGAGVILDRPGLVRLEALPGFYGVEKVPAVGATVDAPWLCTGQAGYAYFADDDPAVVRRSVDTLHAMEDAGELYIVRADLGSAPLRRGEFDVATTVR
jgi:ATP-grasp domain